MAGGTTQKRVTDGCNWGGYTDLGNGLALYCGTGVFVTTGTTAVIYHPFGSGKILSAVVSGNPASFDAQDNLSFQTGTSANLLKAPDATTGELVSVTPGAATVLRDASGSSGCPFSIVMIGRAKH